MVPSDVRPAAAGSTLLDSLASVLPSVRPTDVTLRNYDDSRAYELALRACDDDEVVFQRRYRLDPGESVTERAVLDSGTYDVTVVPEAVDGDATARFERDEATCRVGDDPTETVRVEAGNGVVSVSDGVS